MVAAWTKVERAEDEREHLSMTPEQKVLRYMSVDRFLWMLMRKQLWLSRADLLGDPWEVALSPANVAAHMARSGLTRSEGLAGIIKIERTRTFVSCWSACPHESHALWRIYCGAVNGVAIETTYKRLEDSVRVPDVVELRAVVYETPPPEGQPQPYLRDLVVRKRPMYAYEQEVRVVFFKQDPTEPMPLGRQLTWDPEVVLEQIWIHPSADDSFKETISGAVGKFAPALLDRISWSTMRIPPAM